MTDDELKILIRRAKTQAHKVGPQHALWDAIFDAEAILAGQKAICSRDEIEQELLETVK